MSAAAFLAGLQARGVRLSAVGGRLRAEAPPGTLTPEDKQALVAHKSELLAALYPWPGPCYCCKEAFWWLSREGAVVCGRCHPPAYPDLVETWIPQAACRWKGGLH